MGNVPLLLCLIVLDLAGPPKPRRRSRRYSLAAAHLLHKRIRTEMHRLFTPERESGILIDYPSCGW